MGTYPYQQHSDENENQVEGLGPEVALLEDDGPAEEGHYDRTPADEGNDGNH